MKSILALSTLAVLFSCKQEQKPTAVKAPVVQEEPKIEVNISPFTQKIEATHNKKAFLDKKAIKFDIDIKFGGKAYGSGTVTQLTDGSKIKFVKSDNTQITYTGSEVSISPKDAKIEGARFDIFTWSYFFSLPYKLNDPGTKWSSPSKRPLNDSLHDTQKLTFESGTGDAPDDWYVIYKNAIDNTLAGAAYIVSFGKDVADAEKEPHAIKYNDYQKINDIPISTKWTFHNWNEKDGYGDQIGEVTISNISFLSDEGNLFEKSADSKPVPAP